MLAIIFSAMYFMLPAYVANMFPVFFQKLHLPGGVPISEKFLGSHKTWRGVYAGYIGALLVLFLQQYLFAQEFWFKYSLLDYTQINLWFFAFLFGVGAIVGDMVKSFFKRRLGRQPGSAWFPFDQLDFVFGAILFVYPFFQLPAVYFLAILILTPLLHLFFNLIGYWLGLKEVWW